MRDFKGFAYNGKKIYYITKDVDVTPKYKNGVEMASCYMEVFDENYDCFDVFQVYDEKKVLNALPVYAEIWYDKHYNKKIRGV